MNPVTYSLTLFLLMCLRISQIECGKRYSTGTGSYTDETIDEIISDEDIEQSDDSFGRAVGLGDSSSYEDCAERFGCSDDSIDEDYVYCEGYYGCYEADITATYDAFMDGCHAGHEAQITTGESLYCGGYVGCFMSESVTSGDTVCDGLYGCYNGIMYSTDDFYLLGYIATIASELYGNRSEDAGGDSIYAFGYNTAKFSVVDYVNNIYNYGAYGMYMTDVFTTDIDEFTMVNYGRYSTAYTSVYCSHKTVCTIYCRDTGCYNLEIRVARKSYVYVYYENEDCDSEPDIIVAKSAQDELEWELMYQQKAKLRRQAIDEFKDKYGHEYLGFEEQGGDKMHQAFEEIWNSVRDRMGLETDCKSKSMHKSDITNMISINKKYNNHGSSSSSSQFNVAYASEHHGIEMGLKFKWQFAGYGLLTSIVVYALTTLFMKQKTNRVNKNSYTYQSI